MTKCYVITHITFKVYKHIHYISRLHLYVHGIYIVITFFCIKQEKCHHHHLPDDQQFRICYLHPLTLICDQ